MRLSFNVKLCVVALVLAGIYLGIIVAWVAFWARRLK